MQKTIEELLQSDFIESLKGKTMIAFNGVMSQDAIVGLGEVLRSELHQYHPLNVVNKVFAVFIEMTQNILHYSIDKCETNGKIIGKGGVFVMRIPGGYNLVAVNLVSEKQKTYLENKCETVNGFSEDEIKDHYLNRRKRVTEGESKGAGLGFIDMVRRSGNPIDYLFEPVEAEQYYFFLSSRIIIE